MERPPTLTGGCTLWFRRPDPGGFSEQQTSAGTFDAAFPECCVFEEQCQCAEMTEGGTGPYRAGTALPEAYLVI